jgi:hypothetical protein
MPAPPFFVPGANPETQESIYAALAKFCGSTVPVIEQRIYSITYVHDGEEWTATVGEALRGRRHSTTRRRGQRLERTERLSDPAVVLAIFSGSPFMVVTNERIPGSVGGVGSAWESPFMAGRPKSVTYFGEP